jgi:hypothetical protein
MIGAETAALIHQYSIWLYRLFAVVIAVLSAGAFAVDVEPTLYSNVPVGTNFASIGYSHSSGEVASTVASQLPTWKAILIRWWSVIHAV